MRFAKIDKLEYVNGKGIGVSLYVQGCYHHCKNCFNPETWDLYGGEEWTYEVEEDFLKLLEQPIINRVSILGGDPFVYPIEMCFLLKRIKKKYPEKKIWLWTGYTYEEILKVRNLTKPLFYIDVLVDGRYIDELKDPTLKFRGSSNQRIIDVQKSLETGTVVQIY